MRWPAEPYEPDGPGGPSIGDLPQAPLVSADYEDPDGYMWRVRVPAGAEDLSMGIVIGPPDLTTLGLPPATQRALHNQLWSRGLLTPSDLRGRMMEVHAALRSAYKADAHAVTALYV